MLALDLVELPRLRLSFQVQRRDGVTRLMSVNSPGLFLGWLEGDRATALLRGLPHALVLRADDG